MEFVDRRTELKILKDSYNGDKSALVAIYGRRRIGKTELLAHFTEGIKRSVYYMATKEDNSKQLKALSSQIGIILGDEELIRFGAVDWEALFLRIKNQNTKERLIIAIDEFPYLTRSNNAISSIFQKGWDVYLKDSNVMLILCGSSISMMHSEVLDYSAPLYQRSTSILEIKPLDIDYAISLNTHMKFEDKMLTYFIFGGIPAYYAYTEKSKNIGEVVYNIFKPGSVFIDEPSTILSEETRSEARYLDILELISGGVNRTNEIASKMRIPPSNINRYLDVLERTSLISKIFPITDKQNKRSKRGIYEIKDNYMRFWFRYVKRNRDALSTEGTDLVVERVLKELSQLGGVAFEDFSAKFIAHISGKDLPKLSKIGKWWGKDPSKPIAMGQEEIDIVGLNENTNDILFAECKWSNSKTDIDVYRELRRKASLVQWKESRRREHFVIFSKSGFTDALEKVTKTERVILFDLKTIENELK